MARAEGSLGGVGDGSPVLSISVEQQDELDELKEPSKFCIACPRLSK